MCNVSLQFVFAKPDTRTARVTTQQHLSNQAKQDGMCFVFSDDPDTSAYMVCQNVPLTESARQLLLTPIASAAPAAVDTRKGSIFDVHAMGDKDEPWLSETDH